MVELKNVVKKYKKEKALDNFTWSASGHGIHALLGHNGAGKTTAFLISNGLIPYDSGVVKIFGKDSKKLSSKDMMNIGFLTEKLKLYDELSVKDNLDFFSDLICIKNKNKRKKEIIGLFNLDDFIKKEVKDLSSGMYKKLLIAVTILNDPKLIFLDEPFSGLDPIIVKEISEILVQLSESRTIILSSHALHEVESVSDYVTIMKEGREIISSKLGELYSGFGLEKSFTVSYLEKDRERTETVSDENDLYIKLQELRMKSVHITKISENKISLKDIYNKIYNK